jgi:hypothetical protein
MRRALLVVAFAVALCAAEPTKEVRLNDPKSDWKDPSWMNNGTLLYAIFSDAANDHTVMTYNPIMGSQLLASWKHIEIFQTEYRLQGNYKGHSGRKGYKFSVMWHEADKHLVLAFSGAPDADPYKCEKANKAYRGEGEFNDLIKFPWGKLEGAEVHRGFAAQYETLRQDTHKVLRNHKDAVKVTMTGHGQGGAHATLAALDVGRNFDADKVEAVTFGCPRVGNEGFVKAYKRFVDNTQRVALEEPTGCKLAPQMCLDQATQFPVFDPYMHVVDTTVLHYKTEEEPYTGDFEKKLHALQTYEDCIWVAGRNSKRKAAKAENARRLREAKARGDAQAPSLESVEPEDEPRQSMKPMPMPPMPKAGETKEDEKKDEL